MRRFRSLRWLSCCILLTGVSLSGVCSAQAASEDLSLAPCRVLVLNSYHQGYQWSDGIIRGIKKTFRATLSRADLLIEYYDTKRNSPADEEYNTAFCALLTKKYKTNPVDVLIATDDNAFTFLAKHRDEIFGPKPLVFCGVNNLALPDLYRKSLTKFGGILQISDEEKTIRMALANHPQAKRVYLFSDDTKTGQAFAHYVQAAMKRIRADYPDLALEHIGSNFTHEELREHLRALPKDSIGLITAYVVDKESHFIPADVLYRELTAAAPFPVYCLSEFIVRAGAVGGKVARGYDHGVRVAEMAIEILDGKPLATDAPWQTLENTYLFRYDQLQRWSVPIESLPPGSVVQNLPHPSLWERFWPLLVAGIIGLLVEALIIATMVASRRRLRKVTAELVQNERRYRHMFEFSNDARLLFTADGLFVDANQNAIELLGATSTADFAGKHPSEITYTLGESMETIRQRADELDNAALAAEVSPFEWTLRRFDTGDPVEVIVRLGRIDLQGETHLQAVIHDMTEEYRMMDNLRKSEENLRITLESIGDAVIVSDVQGRVTRMNQVACNLTGWPSSDAMDRPLEDVFHIINVDSRKRVGNPVSLVLDTGRVQGLANHTILISRNGTEYHIADSAAPIRNANDDILGVVMVFQDVTERHQLQQRLNHSQKMEAIGQLAGGIAHDFNNILAGIMGYAELLMHEVAQESTPQSYLSNIIASCDRAANLVSQLLNFAHKGKILSSAIDLHAIIQESEHLLNTTLDKSITTRTDLGAQATSVIGDPTQLQSVILNLGVNARDAMPHGGEFIIHTENITLNEAYCRVSEFDVAPGDYILISVRDTGTGIPAEVLGNIFEPFFTTKPTGEGTGLGLASLHGVVTSHHGAISVYSEVGAGTEFHIYLPVSDAQGMAPAPHPAGEPGGMGETILVIDDEPMIRNMAWSILTDLGYEVLLAENGRRGIELYRENQDGIHLILLDMVMPVLGGREAFEELLEIDPEVRVVMSSGFASDDRIQEMLSLGAKRFVRKPFRIGQLAYAIREVIDEKPALPEVE